MSRRVLVLVSSVYAFLAVLMFGWAAPTVQHSCGMAPPDATVAWGAGYAETFLHACGSPGLQSYARMQVFDLFYPAALCAVLTVWSIQLGRGSWRALAIAAAIVGAAFDYLENLAAWSVIRHGDGWAGSLPLTLAPVASVAKSLADSAAMLLVAGLIVRALATVVLSRRTHPRVTPPNH